MLWFTIGNNVFFNTGAPIFLNFGGCPSKPHALLLFKLVSFVKIAVVHLKLILLLPVHINPIYTPAMLNFITNLYTLNG